MKSMTRSKKSSKPQDETCMLYTTTHTFIERLISRGRPLRVDIRDALIGWMQEKSCSCIDWEKEKTSFLNVLSTLPPADNGILQLYTLCELLSPLHKLDVQYVNLAIIIHSLTLVEIKNLYRYCYIEWMQFAPQPDSYKWFQTPREFANMPLADLASTWERFLSTSLGSCSDKDVSKVLFFLNRIYSYLIPCK